MKKFSACRLAALAVFCVGLSACGGGNSDPAPTGGNGDETNSSNNNNDSDNTSDTGSSDTDNSGNDNTEPDTDGNGGSGDNTDSNDNNQTSDNNSLSQIVPVDANGECPSASASGADTSAIAGLWDASDNDDNELDTGYLLISSNGLATNYDYQQDFFGTGENCYVKEPSTRVTSEGNNIYLGIYYDYLDSDATQCELMADDPVEVIVSGDTINFTDVVSDDSDSDENTNETVTDSYPRVVGVSASDLTLCE